MWEPFWNDKHNNALLTFQVKFVWFPTWLLSHWYYTNWVSRSFINLGRGDSSCRRSKRNHRQTNSVTSLTPDSTTGLRVGFRWVSRDHEKCCVIGLTPDMVTGMYVCCMWTSLSQVLIHLIHSQSVCTMSGINISTYHIALDIKRVTLRCCSPDQTVYTVRLLVIARHLVHGLIDVWRYW